MHGHVCRISVGLIALTASLLRSEEPKFRTDGGDEKLSWYPLKPGEFPPAGSAHAISGELIRVDPINRTGAIRMDRTGSQRTDDYDQALTFTLLPFASLRYHGAPAELRDIPLGTHLHGQFYEGVQGDKKTFSQVLQFDDDFSQMTAAQRVWRIDAVDLGKRTLALTGMQTTDNQADPKPTVLQITPATRVWKGLEIGNEKDLAAGQTVLANLTVCTLKGPGRCMDIWIDAQSREAATAAQLELHRQYQQEHGLACQVVAVDNTSKIVTVTVFGGFAPGLKENFKVKEHIAAAVANQDLRTHDQLNDTARGPIIEVLEGSPSPGQSGLRLRFKPEILLEGFRPGRILRIFGPGWPVDDLPREERAYDG